MNIKYKIFLCFSVFFCMFKNAYANKYCSVDQGSGDVDYVIHLSDLSLSAADERFSIISESSVKKTITCNAPASIKRLRTIVSDIPVQNNAQLTISSRTLGLGDTIDGVNECPILRTDNPGIGIVWFNYNSYSGAWFCGTQVSSWGRDLRLRGSVDIVDKIILLKIGAVTPGEFSYVSNQFVFNEYSGTTPQATTAEMTNNGLLYRIRFDTEKINIKTPVCGLSEDIYGNYEFITTDNYPSSEGFERMIKFHCSGYIEENSPVKFNFISNNGSLLGHDNYYATSVAGLGFSIDYSNDNDEVGKVNIKPSSNTIINTKTTDGFGNGYFYLHFKPFLTNNSGHYPSVDQANMDLKIEPN